MKKLIIILLILGILSTSGIAFAEEKSDPVIWKYKTNSWATAVKTTEDGAYNAGSSIDGSLYLLDKSGAVLWKIDLGKRITSIVFSEDKSKLTAAVGERVYINSMSDGRNLGTSTPDTNYIGGSSSDIYAMVYKEGRPSWDYKTDGKVNSISLTPDGQTLAVASSDNHVYLIRAGMLLWKHDLKLPVISVESTPDSSYVVCGTGSFESDEEIQKDYRIFLFDGQGKLLWNQKIGYTVSSVSITPDGNYIAVGSWDNKVHIFSKSGEHLKEFKTDGKIWSVSITPDGKNVIAGSTDTYVYFLDVDSMQKPEKSSSFNPIYIAIPILIILAAGALIYTKKFKKK
ncbi:MAG: outer membrane biogenesis protein BamB [Candidatus Methanofastidiosum methylothiophilum]|uniref:Outer membrane biogenesis protein BamB n=1 Tax=Candidatus Methanofastidiosum methylothiophilum TaxID=1705564 RepID=A0A150IWB0_9EURY|nr:MAG: outer membrane biogenesis protein BamB [Candidatus Methanofastidiosum methylthiophilus]